MAHASATYVPSSSFTRPGQPCKFHALARPAITSTAVRTAMLSRCRRNQRPSLDGRLIWGAAASTVSGAATSMTVTPPPLPLQAV